MPGDHPIDKPGHVDFRNPAEARAWTQEAVEKRPWREEFFRMFAKELMRLHAEELSILELGSGPGFLARRIMEALPHVAYTALDFSPVMHNLAQQQLGPLSGGVRFVEANFKLPGWNAGMPTFDAVVTMESVHELRDKKGVPALYAAIRKLLHKGGLFLMCDHFLGEGGMSEPEIFMTVEEQRRMLKEAGFAEVTLLLEKNGLALWRARE